MGWPLAVSAALMDRRQSSFFKAIVALAIGHLLSMAAILFPFSVMYVLVDYQREIQIGAAGLVIAMGLYLLVNRRHPRFLARVPPTKLALWSFLAALAHGAGLMLVPLYLGICQTIGTNAGHAAADALMTGTIAIAASVALVHILSMTLSGGLIAFGVDRWMGLKFLSKGWFNLDVVWALSLIVVGVLSLLFSR